MAERIGYLYTQGWAGRSTTKVEVIGETPKRYRIRALVSTKLAGRGRWLSVGKTTLVPKRSITFEESS